MQVILAGNIYTPRELSGGGGWHRAAPSSGLVDLRALLGELADEQSDFSVTRTGDFGSIVGVNLIRRPGVCFAAGASSEWGRHQTDFDVDEELGSRASASVSDLVCGD